MFVPRTFPSFSKILVAFLRAVSKYKEKSASTPQHQHSTIKSETAVFESWGNICTYFADGLSRKHICSTL